MQIIASVFLYICIKLSQNQNTMKLKLLLVLLFSTSFLIAAPSLTLVKSALYFDANGDGFINAGDTIIYTFTVTNTGDVALNNLSVTDVMLTPSTIASTPASLQPTEIATFSRNYTITQADITNGSVTNSATVSGTTTSGIPITDMSDSDNANLPNTNDPTVTQLQMTTHPAIGVILQGQYTSGFYVDYMFQIKNKGDEALTDIYVTGLPVNNTAYTSYSNLNIVNQQNGGIPLVHIASLSPGQEDTFTFRGSGQQLCFSQNQAMVIGTTGSGTKIADISDRYDYYGNYPTQTVFSPIMDFSCDGSYQDLNNNSILDVGDVVNYTYQYNYGSVGEQFTLIDPNVIIANPNGNPFQNWTTTGIHTLTQYDIDLGYVTNSPTVTFPQLPCPSNGPNSSINFNDPTPCINCPTPINCLGTNNNCIITRISALLPNLISGTVKFNTNNNNCTTGIGYPSKLVTTTSGANTYGSFTNASGNYSLYIPNSGSFSTNATANLGTGLSSNPTNVTQVSSGENMNYPASFCISSTTNVNDLSVVLIPIDHARPGFSSYYRLHYENNGTTSLNGSVKVTYNNSKLTLGTFNSNLPDATTANSASYNFTNLLPYQYGDIFITFNVLTPPTVNQGDILTFTTLGTTTVTDANLADNTFVLNQSVVNSFDPNDKTVLEGATITAAQATRPLHYITRFQNTGTFAAVTVVLKETLDADLNWNTIEPIGSSHNYRIQIKNGNQLTVTFDAINLPNSSANEPASHGWFAYKIKPKSTFAVGNVASSNASIYFDYNLPIVTNTVNTQIGTLGTNGFDKNNFKIYPNPANTYFVIENSLGKSSTYEIVTINGKTLSSGIVENLKPIDISELASGFYFVNIKSQDLKQTYKIVKE
jgi:uncharacterized repeat protein (TIGR01451 family)